MHILRPPSLLLTLLLTTLPPSPLLKVHAASPTSFCKCTCFTNSTIIPLDAPTAPLLLLPRHASPLLHLTPRHPNPPPLPWNGADKARLPNAPPFEPDGQGKEKEKEKEDGAEKQQTPASETEPESEDENENDKSETTDEKENEKEKDKEKEYRPGTCANCNRQFCLDYNLPICKHARVEDVFTTCFQRDSRKDEAVVFIFIFATAGLLLWAGVRPWVGGWIEGARERSTYIPVAGQDG